MAAPVADLRLSLTTTDLGEQRTTTQCSPITRTALKIPSIDKNPFSSVKTSKDVLCDS